MEGEERYYGSKVSWRAREFEKKEKSTDWYWLVGIIIVGVSVISFIQGNELFGIFIIIAGGALFLFGFINPRELNFEINNDGIRAGNKIYPYRNLKSFWISENNVLMLDADRMISPKIILPVQEGMREIVREALRERIPEIRTEEPVSLAILEKLGF